MCNGFRGIGLVADGKHRLTVSHYCLHDRLDEPCPFLVDATQREWVKIAIPNAKEI